MKAHHLTIPPVRKVLRFCTCVLGATFLVAASKLPPNKVHITTDSHYRRIQSNGIPDHATGDFPNAHNPNSIAPQHYDYRVPLEPKLAKKPIPYYMQVFGIAVNGVVFDPFAAEWWRGDPNSGWQYEPRSSAIDLGLDQNNGHVQPNGAYHYHGIPNALVERLSGGEAKMTLVGWAADGFPIYGPWGYSDAANSESGLKKLSSSYAIKAGMRPARSPGGSYDGSFVQDYEYVEGSGDLDASNGRSGITPEFPQGTYYYVLTEGFPFIPRQYAGQPDASFQRRGGPPGGGGPPPRGGRRGGPGRRPPPGGPPPF